MAKRDRQRQRPSERMRTDELGGQLGGVGPLLGDGRQLELVTEEVEARLPRDDDEAYYFALGILVRQRGLSWDEAHRRARAVSRSFR
jgi:hypothetical protein